MTTPAHPQPIDHEQEQPKRATLLSLPEKARAAFEAIGVRIHEPSDEAPLLARWQRAVA